jgi:hypothetical protein
MISIEIARIGCVLTAAQHVAALHRCPTNANQPSCHEGTLLQLSRLCSAGVGGRSSSAQLDYSLGGADRRSGTPISSKETGPGHPDRFFLCPLPPLAPSPNVC